MNRQQGFTLVELVIVIVILGILAAVAVPRFFDLSADAERAATQGVAGALTSASSINFAARRIGNASAERLNQANICTDAILNPLMTGTPFVPVAPTTNETFQVSGTGDCSGTAEAVTCTVTSRGGIAVPAQVFCAR